MRFRKCIARARNQKLAHFVTEQNEAAANVLPQSDSAGSGNSRVMLPGANTDAENPKSFLRVFRAFPKMWSSRNGRTVIAGITFIVCTFVAMILPSSYLVQTAGPAIDVNSKIDGKRLVTITAAKTYPSKTKLFMTTVSAWGTSEQGVPGAQAFGALFRSADQLIPVRAYYPEDVSADDAEAENALMMTNSQDSAALLAFEMAGYPVSMDVKIVGIDRQAPSGKVLQLGDIIRGIRVDQGNFATEKIVETKSHYQLSKVLDRVAPDTSVTLEIERDGKRQEVSCKTIPFDPDSTGWVHPGSLLGVAITVENVKLPAQVKYLVDGIGGPSAGNMFALGIYDALTPGNLGADAKIAGTGTVAWDGDVGPIGGITHKLAGAAEQGVTDFLAPAENCIETVGFLPEGMRLWAVRTTDESVKAVEAIGAGDTTNLTSCADIVAQMQSKSKN